MNYLQEVTEIVPEKAPANLKAVSLAGGRRRMRQMGLSLVELMVSLLIGAFIVLGLVTFFMANWNSSQLESSLARLQENGRFAVDLIREDLYRSQFLGCNTGDVFLFNMIEDPASAGFSPTLEGIRGYERQGAGAWPAVPTSTDLSAPITAAETAGGARNGSDVLTVRMNERLNPDAPLLANIVTAGGTTVDLSDNPDCVVDAASRIVVTGCGLTAHLFEVTNTQSCTAATPPNPASLEFDGTANFETAINSTYNVESEILLFEEAHWFVADTGRNRNGFDVWALYREINGVREEMIEGVEHMQVKFGQRVTGTGAIRFVDPSDAVLNTGDNYERVVSVRVSLLLQDYRPVRNSLDTRSYLLIDEQVPGGAQGATHAGGAVQRTVFSTTLAMRNAPEV